MVMSTKTISYRVCSFPYRPCHQSAPSLHDAPSQCSLQSVDPPRLIQSVPLFTAVHPHHAPAHHPPTHSHLTARFRQCLYCINRSQLINCLFHSLCQILSFSHIELCVRMCVFVHAHAAFMHANHAAPPTTPMNLITSFIYKRQNGVLIEASQQQLQFFTDTYAELPRYF